MAFLFAATGVEMVKHLKFNHVHDNKNKNHHFANLVQFEARMGHRVVDVATVQWPSAVSLPAGGRHWTHNAFTLQSVLTCSATHTSLYRIFQMNCKLYM